MISNYRNAVNGDSLQNYFEYFDLSRFVSVTINDMFNRGELYKYFTHDDIGKMQVIYSEFSLGWEKVLNEEIEHNKRLASEDWAAHKTEVVDKVNFWDKKFQEHKKTLETIKNKLPL